MFYSPLRYPGGKSKLSKFLGKVCSDNNVANHYVEPYAGGAGVALFLLIEGYVETISINDVDRSIYAFRYAILNSTNKFINNIRRTEVSLKNWQKQKDIQRRKNKVSLFSLGFSTFFLNRTNVSGIINAGAIGGRKQIGKYKIDCRFNKEELISKIKLIAQHKDRIKLYNMDALELVDKIEDDTRTSQNSTIFYFDPPYYLKGQSLYLNSYEKSDHYKVSERIKKMKNAQRMVSYDNCPEIRVLYHNISCIEYSFVHTAYRPREGKEILFFSKNLRIPLNVHPTNINSER